MADFVESDKEMELMSTFDLVVEELVGFARSDD